MDMLEKICNLIKDRITMFLARASIWIEIVSAVVTALSQLLLWHTETFVKCLPYFTLEQVKLFKDEHLQYFIWIPLLLIIISLISRSARFKFIAVLEGKVSGLTDELTTMQSIKDNISSLFMHHLIAIANALKFTDEERISLYIKRRNKRGHAVLTLCTRYSISDTYKKPGRPEYKIQNGVIGKAWDKGEICIKFPDWQIDEEAYIKKCKEYGYDSKLVKKLAMHPRLIYGYRIANENKLKYESLIIIESMKENFATNEDINKVVALHRESMYSLVSDFREAIPLLPNASERGF